MQELVEKQREFYNSGVTLDYKFRMDALYKLRKSIMDNKQLVMDSFIEDFNKSNFDVLTTEYALVIQEIDYMTKHLKHLMKKKRVRTDIINFSSHGLIVPHPYGVVLIMSPWNYPFQLALSPLVAAIAAGNTAVVKPSNYSPKVSLAISRVLSVFSDNYVTTILGGRDKNQDLLDQKWDYIFFTGGKKVGSIVMQKASANLTPISLELGSKSPCIVTESADLDKAAKRIVWGKFLNAGQTCIAPDYLLVNRNVNAALKEKLIAKIKLFYYNNNIISNDFPYIINDKHLNRLKGLLDQDKVVFGGAVNNRLMEPTLMENVTFNDPIMQEEIFGPILPIIVYDKAEEIADKINSFPHPLAFYLFSNDKAEINYFLKRCTFGGGCINDTIMHLTNTNLPFGGVGESGMGCYHGVESFNTFTHYKSVLVKGKVEVNIKYPPYTIKKYKKIEKIMNCKD